MKLKNILLICSAAALLLCASSAIAQSTAPTIDTDPKSSTATPGAINAPAFALNDTPFPTAVLKAPEGVPTDPANAPTGNTILDQVKGFLSNPDRGLGTFKDKSVDVWLGSCFENNINADGIIGADYNIYKRIVLDGYARIWNSSDTIKSLGFGPGVELPIGDLKVGLTLNGVWRFDDDCFAIAPALQLKNGVGKNSYLGMRLETDFEIKGHHAEQRPFLATFFGINF